MLASPALWTDRFSTADVSIRHFVSTENAGRGYTRAIGGKSYVERVLRVRLLRSIDSCSNEDSDIKHPVRQLFLPSSRIANLPLDLFKEDFMRYIVTTFKARLG